VGGGSNAIGLFHPFIEYKDVRMVGVEPAGEGIPSGFHGASLAAGSPGIFHGQRTFVLSDADGQILPAHSVSAGLDYPGVGPEHAFLKDAGRVEYEVATDAEALDAFGVLSKTEGIIPALESAHAIAYVLREGSKMSRDDILIVNLSGRGDKDVAQVREILKRSCEDSEK
jgi:tryptophan synthase beta chain